MSAFERAKESIMIHEGLRLKPYYDTVGKLTIGYGHNLDDNGISEEAAEFILEQDMIIARREASYAVETYAELNEARRAVLIEMAFNLGLPRLVLFKRMIAALLEHDYEQAALEMLDSKWASQVGNRANVLAERMRTGI